MKRREFMTLLGGSRHSRDPGPIPEMPTASMRACPHNPDKVSHGAGRGVVHPGVA